MSLVVLLFSSLQSQQVSSLHFSSITLFQTFFHFITLISAFSVLILSLINFFCILILLVEKIVKLHIFMFFFFKCQYIQVLFY